MHTRWVTICICVAVCFLVGSIFVASAQRADRADRADRYVNTEHRISFTRPAGWPELVPDNKMDGLVAFMGPVYGKHQANILVSVVVGSEVIPKNEHGKLLDMFLKRMIRTKQKENGNDFNLLKTARIKIAGEDAVSMLFNARHPKSGEWLKDRQIFMIHENQLYAFNLAVREPEFPQAVGKIEKLLNSINWIEPLDRSAINIMVP